MVSTSRKKNKGKERKAKKEAARVETERVEVHKWWLAWAVGFAGNLAGEYVQCNHGCGEIPIVSSFLDTFFSNMNKKEMTTNVRDSFETHPQVWNDKINKKMAMNILTRMGTNMMLQENSLFEALTLAKVIVLFEHYDNGGIEAVINSRQVQTKVRDLSDNNPNSGSRDGLKFYSKRISCSCLKSMHQEARRTLPKIGFCMNCKEEMKRVDLSVCSRCMVDQYCSRECQVAHWPQHKRFCDQIVHYSDRS